MKTNLRKWMVAIFLPLTVCVMSSCCDDEDDEASVINNNAGTFAVTNISYDDSVDRLSVKAIEIDTLKVKFTPQSDYQSENFIVECPPLKKLNDSLFVVEGLKVGDNEIMLTATCKKEKETLSKAETLKISVPEKYVIMPYHLTMSKDLEELVQPEVSYTDGDGHIHTYKVSTNDIVRPDSTLVEMYEDVNGKTHLVYDGEGVPETDWTKVEERKLANPTYYDFNVRYYKVGISSNVTVRYLPRHNVELTRERYYLSHCLDRGSATVHIPNLLYMDSSTSFRLTIKIGGEDGIGKDEVASALEELEKTPDVINLNIFIGNFIEEVME